MKKPLAQSLIFHCLIVIILIITSWGIFARKDKIPDEVPITIELMPNVPMGAKTNVKPAPKRDEKPTPPKAAAKPPAPKPPEKKPEPKQQPKVEPKPVKETPKPMKEKPKIDPKKQKDDLSKMLEELDKKDKKPEPKKKDDSELDSMLKDLDKKPASKKSSEEKNTDPNSTSDAKFDETQPVSQSEVGAITKLITDQIKSCWSPPAGVINAKGLIVRVNVDITQAGVMKFAGFEGSGNGDPMYRVAEEAARRAVLDPECNPLRQLPPQDKYYIWKEMTLIFDPKDLNY